MLRVKFPSDDKSLQQVQETYVLSILVAECLYSQAQVRMEVAHYADEATNVWIIKDDTKLARDHAKVFIGLCLKEFGPDAFMVEIVNKKNETEGDGTNPLS